MSDQVLFGKEDIDALYHERALLIANLAKRYRSFSNYSDHSCPDWLIVFLETPEGQISWHISPEDKYLFAHVTIDTLHEWDGHTKEEAMARLERLVMLHS